MLTVAQIKRRKTTSGGFLAHLCFFNRTKLHFRISLHPIVTEIYQPFSLIWNFRNVTHIEKTNTFFCSTNVHLLCLFVTADTSQNLTHTHRNVLKITHTVPFQQKGQFANSFEEVFGIALQLSIDSITEKLLKLLPWKKWSKPEKKRGEKEGARDRNGRVLERNEREKWKGEKQFSV